MAARAQRPLERLRERIVAGDRGWFFAQIADRVAERRMREVGRLRGIWLANS